MSLLRRKTLEAVEKRLIKEQVKTRKKIDDKAEEIKREIKRLKDEFNLTNRKTSP